MIIRGKRACFKTLVSTFLKHVFSHGLSPFIICVVKGSFHLAKSLANSLLNMHTCVSLHLWNVKRNKHKWACLAMKSLQIPWVFCLVEFHFYSMTPPSWDQKISLTSNLNTQLIIFELIQWHLIGLNQRTVQCIQLRLVWEFRL